VCGTSFAELRRFARLVLLFDVYGRSAQKFLGSQRRNALAQEIGRVVSGYRLLQFGELGFDVLGVKVMVGE
jgi:hypothetical protein